MIPREGVESRAKPASTGIARTYVIPREGVERVRLTGPNAGGSYNYVIPREGVESTYREGEMSASSAGDPERGS